MNSTITPENVEQESYFNCIRLAVILGWANPIRAIKELGLSVTVTRDDCGNIKTAALTQTVLPLGF